jgi:hypothetical protein
MKRTSLLTRWTRRRKSHAGEGMRSDRWYPDLVNYRDVVEQTEVDNQAKTRESLNGHYSAVLLVDGMIGMCFAHYQSITPGSTERTQVTALSNRAHTNLLSAWRLVERGAYGPAAILTRAIYEDWLSLVYYRAHPAEAVRWWDSGQGGPTARELDFGNLKGQLIQEGILPIAERAAYSMLSSMAHPSADSAMAYLRPPARGETDGLEIKPVGRFLLPAARHSANLILILGLRILKHFEGFPGMESPGSPIGADTPYREVVTDLRSELGLDDSELQDVPSIHYRIGRHAARRP